MSQRQETISIVMPAYNAERHIARAIESVLNQTHRDFELLIIDDGSRDRTLEIAREFEHRDSRIRVITQPNSGVAHTMNHGLRSAKSEWVFCMHADDEMMPNRIERQLAFLAQHPEVAVASSLVFYIDDSGHIIGKGRCPYTDPKRVERAVKTGEAIAFNHPATAMRRLAALEAGGYRQEFWPAEDVDLWNRIAERGHQIAVQDEHLLKYRIHGSSASISRARLMQQKAIWLEKCIRCRRSGMPEPTWEQFIDQSHRAPLWERLSQWRREVGRTLYQAAQLHYSTRHYAALALTIVGAAALEPLLVLSRVWPRLVREYM